jgi:hypothetical protein
VTPSIFRTHSNRLVCVFIKSELVDFLKKGRSGAFTVGKITDEQRFDVVRHACPGAGACGGMYTYVEILF